MNTISQEEEECCDSTVFTEHHETSRDHPSIGTVTWYLELPDFRRLLVPEPDRSVLCPLRWFSKYSLSSLRYICTLVYIFMWHSPHLASSTNGWMNILSFCFFFKLRAANAAPYNLHIKSFVHFTSFKVETIVLERL